MCEPATTVVNIRRQYYDIYVGRNPLGQKPSQWGNPFVVGSKLTRKLQELVQGEPVPRQCQPGHVVEHGEAVALYRALLDARLRQGELTRDDFTLYYGYRLGCFCKPRPCHGDVIAEYVEWFHRNPEAQTGPPRQDD